MRFQLRSDPARNAAHSRSVRIPRGAEAAAVVDPVGRASAVADPKAVVPIAVLPMAVVRRKVRREGEDTAGSRRSDDIEGTRRRMQRQGVDWVFEP
ncbi:hypothetical protein GCM10029978_028690 [Actinoallomurus acanthiterrae]